MFARVNSAATIGVDAYVVQVEVDLSLRGPGNNTYYSTVGLPDAAVKESKDRVLSALRNSDLYAPMKSLTVNLAPADVRKEGPVFDLPISIGILAARGDVEPGRYEKLLFLGELSLDGNLRRVSGVLPIAEMLRRGEFDGIVLPPENAEEAALVEDVKVYPIANLAQTVDFLNGRVEVEPYKSTGAQPWNDPPRYGVDFVDIRGQEHAKRALEIAAAGGHNAILLGAPGAGKTMLSRCLPTILPDLSRDECLEVTKLYSISGLLAASSPVIRTRPFRAPHHTISNIALVGGGSVPRPGEVSLSHHGVLFLDELPEFKRDVLEVMRQPVEDGFVTISRASGTLTFPASFMLIGAMNPCPCGWFGDSDHPCICKAGQIQRYVKKISGPLLDRMDIHIEVPRVDAEKLTGAATGETSDVIRERVNAARRRQIERYAADGIHCNAELNTRMLKKYCVIPQPAQDMLKEAIKKFSFTARAYDRIRKLSRTIADLAASGDIGEEHVAEAILLRTLDRKYWS